MYFYIYISKFRYLGRTLTNQNSFQEEIKNRMKKHFSSYNLLCKSLKIMKHRTTILPVVFLWVWNLVVNIEGGTRDTVRLLVTFSLKHMFLFSLYYLTAGLKVRSAVARARTHAVAALSGRRWHWIEGCVAVKSLVANDFSGQRNRPVLLRVPWLFGRFGSCGLWKEISCWFSVNGRGTSFRSSERKSVNKREGLEKECVVQSGRELDGGRRVTLWMSPQYSGIYGHVILRTMEHIT